MLSGEGADEIFAGYTIYRYMALVERYRRLPGWLRAGAGDPDAARPVRRTGRRGSTRPGPGSAWRSATGATAAASRTPCARSCSRRSSPRSLADGHLQETIDGYYATGAGKDPVSRMLYLDTKTWLPEDLLVKADKMTMAAAVELRVPFLDHRLVELAASFPTRHEDPRPARASTS